MIIYKITNKLNGKTYIGQTIRDINTRFKEHCNKINCRALNSAIKKYGQESFLIECLEIIENNELLNEREQYWINFYQSMYPSGYNLTTGGDSSFVFGQKRSEDFCKKRSDYMKNRVITLETRQKMKLAASSRKNNIKKCFLIENDNKLEFNSLKDLAKHLNYSPSFVTNIIKKQNGKHKQFSIEIEG